jgi:2'-5' RNA ligase
VEFPEHLNDEKEKFASQEIVIEDEDGTALGLVLQDDAEIAEWCAEWGVNPELMKPMLGKKVGVLDEITAFERGKGTGSAILDEFVYLCKNAGAACIVLMAANESNPKDFDLEDWYKKRGFQSIGQQIRTQKGVQRESGYPIMVKWLTGKTAAAKLPKGWRVTLKREKSPGDPYGFYWGHIWKDGLFMGTCPIGSEYRDKAREHATEWAWQMSGQKTAKTTAKHATTQINLPEEMAWKLRKLVKQIIPQSALMGDGYEENPHITVKYGVEENEQKLIEAVGDQEPFTIRFGKTHVFDPSDSSDDAAPVVINIEAPELEKLHNRIDKAMSVKKDDFPYHPHATLAYVKPELAKEYDGLDFLEGVEFEATNVTISKKDHIMITVDFGRTPKTASKGDDTSSLLLGVDYEKYPEFPVPVIVRYPQKGMPWRTVLKFAKQIVGQIMGRRIPWVDIHVWGPSGAWDTYTEQQERFPQWAVKQKFVMYDILEDGTFRSVGKPVIPPSPPEPSPTVEDLRANGLPDETKTSAEKMRMSVGMLMCPCENSSNLFGFTPSDRQGKPVNWGDEDTKVKYMMCRKCGRVFNQKTLSIVGQVNQTPEGEFSGQSQQSLFASEKVTYGTTTEGHSYIKCPCGNNTYRSGFYPSDIKGREEFPDKDEEADYITCDECGRVVHRKTKKVVGQRQGDLFYNTAAVERITKNAPDGSDWVCVCGNTPYSDGFNSCDENGHEVEPVEDLWDGKLYVCNSCGRIIDQKTLRVVGQKQDTLFKQSAERIKGTPGKKRLDQWDLECICGNANGLRFRICTKDGGRETDPEQAKYLCCKTCGRIIDLRTLKVIGLYRKNLFGDYVKTAERIKGTPKGDGNDWVCICGNTLRLDDNGQGGFRCCNRNGEIVQYEEWDKKYFRCTNCGRIISVDTLQVKGQSEENLFGGFNRLSAKEKITKTPEFSIICPCGNTPKDSPGFRACNQWGDELSEADVEKWHGRGELKKEYPYFRCRNCGRIINYENEEIVGRSGTTPDLFGGFIPQKKGSHKTPPLSDTVYPNLDIGQETNAYADIPERVEGTEMVPSLMEMVPEELQKKAAQFPSLQEVLAYGSGSSVEAAVNDLVSNWGVLREKVKDLPKAEQEEALNQLGFEEVQRRWDQVAALIRSHKFPLTVYRGICGNTIKEIVTDPSFVTKNHVTGRGLGVYWTYDERSAYLSNELLHNCPSWGKKGIIMFRAVISDPAAVDWLHTAWTNLAAEDEQEVHLVKGAHIQVTGVKKYGENAWRKPPARFHSVVASQDELFPVSSDDFQPGSRVSYGKRKGVIEETLGRGALIQFDDGELTAIPIHYLKLIGFANKTAVYAEAQNSVQHSDQSRNTVGMYKTPKSDPFQEEWVLFGPKDQPQDKEPETNKPKTSPSDMKSLLNRTAGKRRFPSFKQWVKAHPEFGITEEEFDPEESSSEYSPDSLQERYSENVQWLSDPKLLPLEIYRALEIEKSRQPNLDEAGIHWTWVEDSADAYFGGSSMWARQSKPKNPVLVFLKAVVSNPNDIDFEKTLFNNMQNPDENEITLQPGAQIKLLGVSYDDSGYQKPTQNTITAATKTALDTYLWAAYPHSLRHAIWIDGLTFTKSDILLTEAEADKAATGRRLNIGNPMDVWRLKVPGDYKPGDYVWAKPRDKKPSLGQTSEATLIKTFHYNSRKPSKPDIEYHSTQRTLFAAEHTRAEGEEIVAALREVFPEFAIKLVGSVASEGLSENDFDILITGEGLDDASHQLLMDTFGGLGWESHGPITHEAYGEAETFSKGATRHDRQWIDVWFDEAPNLKTN